MLKCQQLLAIVGILTFISMINTTSERLKARNFFICQYVSFSEQLKFRALSVENNEYEKSFITSMPGICRFWTRLSSFSCFSEKTNVVGTGSQQPHEILMICGSINNVNYSVRFLILYRLNRCSNNKKLET